MRVLKAEREFIAPLEERITDSAHASTLLKLKDGSVLAAWFGGSWEKDPNVNIYMAKRSPDGNWSAPRLMGGCWHVASWNPVLFRAPDDSILLFFKSGPVIPEWKTFVRRSCDEGESWSEAEELVQGDTSGGRGPVKNKPILLSDGRTIVAPASYEKDETWICFTDISEDCGKTWKRGDFVPLRRSGYNIQMVDQPYSKYRCFGKGMIQPTLWEDENGDVHMFTRTTSSAIFTSISHDKGLTWEQAYDTGLPNNNSGLDLVRAANGIIYLCYNPVGNLPNYYKGPRTPLVIDFSEDNGQTWKHLITLEDAPGDYAYPAIIADGDSRLLVTYTYKRETICFWDIEIGE